MYTASGVDQGGLSALCKYSSVQPTTGKKRVVGERKQKSEQSSKLPEEGSSYER